MSNRVTTLSSKGQVVVPAETRRRRGWQAGTRLIVEERPGGVFLRAVPLFPPTRLEDVAGMLRYKGPAKTIEEMDIGVLAEANRQHDRG